MAATAPTSKSRSSRQTKFLIGAFLIFAVIGYLIFFGLSNTSQYFLTVGELQSKGSSAVGQGVRVGGNLVPKSINKDIKASQIAFAITDGTKQLDVRYGGVVPDTFDQATEVIAEGKLGSDGTFVATQVLAKCPSKYDASKLEWYDTANGGNTQYGH